KSRDRAQRSSPELRDALNPEYPGRAQGLLLGWLLLAQLSTFLGFKLKSQIQISDLRSQIKTSHRFRIKSQNLFLVRKRTAILIDRIKVISTSVAAHACACHSS